MDSMNERDLHKFTGSLQQVAHIRPIRYQDGRADFLPAYQVKNGSLSFTSLAGKCLDIAECSYKGVNISFLSKPGLMGLNHFDTHGAEAQRSIMGGLFFTCGFENICPPCVDGGREYPMHGRIRTTPAEHLQADAFWREGRYTLCIRGEMHEAELFGENIVLRRTIETVYGEKSIVLEDVIQNKAFRSEPLLLLYHFNIGYPLLGPGAEIVLPSIQIQPRDSFSDASVWSIVEQPQDNALEQVFTHMLATEENGDTFAALLNNELELGFMLAFNRHSLPEFMEWKSMGSGDYVVGLEPANASMLGRLAQKERGFDMLEPFETRTYRLEMTILDGKNELDEIRRRVVKLLKKQNSKERII